MTRAKSVINVMVENSVETATTVDGAHWYDKDGRLHRDNGPAHDSIWVRAWYKHGKRHRDDGPAIDVTHGAKEWFRDDKRHRTDGPAIDYADGFFDQYWVNDRRFTEEEFCLYVDTFSGEVLIPPGKTLLHDS